MINPDFLEILVCPACKGKLEYHPEQQQLICRFEKLAYPITDDGIPVLLVEQARPLNSDPEETS